MGTFFVPSEAASKKLPVTTQSAGSGAYDEQSTAPPAGARFTSETVLSVRYWTPGLLSFRTSRAPGFRFKPGHYGRLGLGDSEETLVWRPFSFVSGAADPHLEFFATLVPGGEFSGPLSRMREGDAIRVDRTSYGFMTIDQFAPGPDLWLLASGTGLGPFLSILRDPETHRSYEHVVVVHSVRYASELAYRDEIAAITEKKQFAESRMHIEHVPVVTRDRCTGVLEARIPKLIEDGRLEQAAGLTLDVQRSRIMVCGNPDMARELRAQLTARGFRTNRRAAPGQLAFENYWLSKPSVPGGPRSEVA